MSVAFKSPLTGIRRLFLQSSRASAVPVRLYSGLNWVPTNSIKAESDCRGKPVVVGGHEGGGTTDELWVIRAWQNKALIPGKYRVNHHMAHVPYNGREITVDNIEVLCLPEDKVRWVSDSNGNYPEITAIKGGHTDAGKPLYIARAMYNMAITPGMLDPYLGLCYIPFDGKAVSCLNYEVLCFV